MIEDLKICAEFLGWEHHVALNQFHTGKDLGDRWEWQLDGEKFKPHQESGRHWLVEILRKFDDAQLDKYTQLLLMKRPKEYGRNPKKINRWIHTAPSDISFKCIMEVITVKETPKP